MNLKPTVWRLLLGYAVLFPCAVRANDYGCAVGTSTSVLGPLTKEERIAVRSEAPNGNPIVAEAISMMKPPPLRDWDLAGHVTQTISWHGARKLILMGAAEAVFITHDHSVRLITRTGRHYRAVEPNSGETTKIIDTVDPCHVFISYELQ